MPPIRKYDFGYAKRLKKRKVEQLVERQRGALDRFVVKQPQCLVNVQQNDVEELNDSELNIVEDNVEEEPMEKHVEEPVESNVDELGQNDNNNNDGISMYP
ncbi:hypothetical protein M0R45_009032 [Rubus argutus]|uniref:Uncharacterized protein n=1 Tax=Rubus argutus TaxID=59490 RepID=A0AAW1Y5V6_RUBAR